MLSYALRQARLVNLMFRAPVINNLQRLFVCPVKDKFYASVLWFVREDVFQKLNIIEL